MGGVVDHHGPSLWTAIGSHSDILIGWGGLWGIHLRSYGGSTALVRSRSCSIPIPQFLVLTIAYADGPYIGREQQQQQQQQQLQTQQKPLELSDANANKKRDGTKGS